MLEMVPLEASRIRNVKLQPALKHELTDPDKAHELAQSGPCYALVDEKGHTIACAGIADQGNGYGFFWSYIGRDATPYMVQLTREARLALDHYRNRFPKVMAFALIDYDPAQRFMKMLGFQEVDPGRTALMGNDGQVRLYQLFEFRHERK